MSDHIDRQAAIDALCGECQGRCIPCEHYPCGEVEALKHLPSAQPEIIRCEECSRCQIDTIYHDYWCDGKKVCKEHYCGYAERRTDER